MPIIPLGKVNPNVANMLTGKTPVPGAKPQIISLASFGDALAKNPPKPVSKKEEKPKSLLQKAGNIIKGVTDFTLSPITSIATSRPVQNVITPIIQGTTRTAASLITAPLSMMSGETDKSKFTMHNEALFGKDKKVEPLNVFAEQQRQVGENYAKAHGADPVNAKVAGLGYAGLAVAGGLTDFLPGVTEGKAVKTLAETEDLVKTSGILRKLGIADDLIAKYTPQIAKMKDSSAIEKTISIIKNEQAIKDPLTAVRNFNITEAGSKRILDNVESIRPELEKLKGGKLTNQEVIDAAGKSSVYSKVIPREQTKMNLAALEKVKQDLAAAAEGKGISPDFLKNLQVIKSHATDYARGLQSFNIGTTVALSDVKSGIVQKLTDLGIEADKILEASKGVDFNNSKQVTELYRKFVTPTLGELLDEYRYGNLLSSPKTHIINAFSNVIQAVVTNPATKLASGLVDNIGSLLTPKQQEHYVSEVPAYFKGMANSVGDAFTAAKDVMTGNIAFEKPDFNRVASNSKLTVVHRQFLNALEAGDAFFRTLIKSGEMESLATKYTKMGKTFTPETLTEEASKKAEYYLYRKALDPSNKTGQGIVLSGIDKVTQGVMKMRDNKVIGWIVPFVQTPMNIFKQGIEYSPLGLATLVGNENKTEQLGKSLIGSTVFAGGMHMALKGDTTWAAPTNQSEKDLFYASGKQPYSIKIGDKWYSYSKLGPLAYPLAFAAATQYYWHDNPKAATQSAFERTGQILGGISKFFGDQSYVQGIGGLVDVMQGNANPVNYLENLASQAVPLVSLQRWINQIVDPIYRQTPKEWDAKLIIKSVQSQFIGQSKILDPYTDPNGDPSKRQYPGINSVNPLTVTKENPGAAEQYNLQQEVNRLKAKDKQQKDDAKTRVKPVYDHVQELLKEGRTSEALDITSKMSKEDYQIYNSLKKTDTTKLVNDLQPQMLKTYEKVQSLINEGKMDEATQITKSMLPEEYKAYQKIKNLVNSN